MAQLTHKIKSISPQKRTKHRFNITLESGDVFGISEDVFISENIAKGQEFTTTQLDNLLEKESVQKIKFKVINLLSYRHRSRNELFKRLVDKGHDKNVILDVLDDLTEKGYINDKEFAVVMIQHLVTQKQLGRRAVIHELMKHQLDPTMVETILDRILVEYPPEKTIVSIIEKRMKTRQKNLKEKHRLISFLNRKGYFWHDFEQAIQSIEWREE